MLIKRLTVSAVLLGAIALSGPLHATDAKAASDSIFSAPVAAWVAPPLLQSSPAFNLASSLTPAALSDANPLLVASTTAAPAAATGADASANDAPSAAANAAQQNVTDLRKALLAAAMSLRDIRYVRGGSNPSTGFDCSGFVRYVFAHAIGLQLPNTSATQFMEGVKVTRANIKPGDLVFFHTHGRGRISHVGIYISNGRFIHSPTSGKSVEISSLDSGYWAKRFAGAKRPEAMALAKG